MTGELVVVERGRRLAFSFEDVLRYHGPGSPGGVAHAFKVLERALPLLEPRGWCERRELTVRTAFGGPGRARRLRGGHPRGHRRPLRGRPGARPAGARAGTRALRLPARAPRPVVALDLREGYVTDEFIDLARTEGRDAAQERRLDALKLEMAERVMARPAQEVYDAEVVPIG